VLVYAISPGGMPPILIIHGNADKLAPIQQAKSFVAKCEEVNSPVKLIVKPGLGHGWPKIETDLATATEWLDGQLLGKPETRR
jgi:acetyl esterase/lipase